MIKWVSWVSVTYRDNLTPFARAPMLCIVYLMFMTDFLIPSTCTKALNLLISLFVSQILNFTEFVWYCPIVCSSLISVFTFSSRWGFHKLQAMSKLRGFLSIKMIKVTESDMTNLRDKNHRQVLAWFVNIKQSGHIVTQVTRQRVIYAAMLIHSQFECDVDLFELCTWPCIYLLQYTPIITKTQN